MIEWQGIDMDTDQLKINQNIYLYKPSKFNNVHFFKQQFKLLLSSTNCLLTSKQ
jgi:hypothetical protein